MKPFKCPQKQWVLATALLAVLAVNVSFNPHHAKSGSIDLASDFGPKSSADRAAAREAKKKEFQEKQTAGTKKEKAQKNKGQNQKKKDQTNSDENQNKTEQTNSDDNQNENEQTSSGENQNENEQTNKDVKESAENDTSEAKVTNALSFNVITARGKVNVTTFKTDEDHLVAVLPEGTICPTCGTETIVFSKNIKDLKLDQLQSKILKYIEEKKGETKVVSGDVEEAPAKEQKSEEPKAEVAEIDPFDGIEKKCNKKSEKMAELECFKDEFLLALTNTRKSKTKMAGEDINSKDASRFYQEHINKRIIDIIREARENSSAHSISHLNGGFYSNLGSANYLFDDTDSNELIAGVSNIFSDLIAKVPKRFENIRGNIIAQQEMILRSEAKAFKDTQNRALTTTNYDEYPYLVSQAENLKNEFKLMRQEFYSRNEDSLSAALSDKNITYGNYNQYLRNLTDFNNNLANGLMGKNTFLSGADLAFAPELGTRIGLSSGPRILNINPAVSTRTGANTSIIVSNNRSILSPEDIIDYRSGLVSELNTVNTSFLPFSAATAGNLQQAAAIRARMQRSSGQPN